MDGYLIDSITAVWFGILTSISPCPLATNIAAVSFIGRLSGHPRKALWSGVGYTAGRTIIYVLLGMLLVVSTGAIPRVSMFLQLHFAKYLGPILIVVGILLLDLVPIRFSGFTLSTGTQQRLANSGFFGAFGLGAVFALAFCPVSAALFFGSTVSLAVKHSSHLIMPSLYGIGTALPVIAVALVLTFSAQAVGKLFHNFSIIEKWARRVSALIVITAGVYMVLTRNFDLL